jgi:hypothetical protein
MTVQDGVLETSKNIVQDGVLENLPARSSPPPLIRGARVKIANLEP